jgi:hypothetical protein
MDLRMPGVSGFEAIRQIAQSNPDIGILVLTMFDDDESVFAAMQAGARGYVLKEASRREIIRAVQAVATGETVFGPAVARRLLSHVSQGAPPLPFPDLTPRERTILDLIATGYKQPDDRSGARIEPQDDPEPDLRYLHQALGLRPGAGDRTGPRGGARNCSRAELTSHLLRRLRSPRTRALS